jgi:hypothetical protein
VNYYDEWKPQSEVRFKYDDHAEHVRVLGEWQRAQNAHMTAVLAAKQFLGPLPVPSRWQKAKRRVASRWSRIRCRVALWIAPELNDY